MHSMTSDMLYLCKYRLFLPLSSLQFGYNITFILFYYINLAIEDGSIRLADGQDSSEGRVEIFYNGVWGTVCDDSWDMNDAQVVCWQLGFLGAIEALGSATFGQGKH